MQQVKKSRGANAESTASSACWYLVFTGEVLGGRFLEYPAEQPKDF